jgi:hypothetical protein
MKTTKLIPAALLASALFTTGALAQTSATMSSPAASPAPAVTGPQPTQFVYVPQLPTPADIVNGAKTQGVTVSRVDQVNGEVIVGYTYPNGQTSVVAFQLLPAQGAQNSAAAAPAVPMPATAAPAVVGSTTVVYDTVPAYGYYPADYYYPYYGYGYGYPVIGVGLGFGYRGGWGYHGGGWGGGFHGGGFHR